MKQVFQTVLQLSLSGSLLILALLLLRLCFRRFPKWGNVALWGLVVVRLLLPFRIESRFSMIPGKTMPQYDFVDTVPVPDVGEVPTVTAPDWDPINLVALVWLLGVLLFLLWFAFSYYRLQRKLRTAVRLRDNIYQSEFVATPMVVGFIQPRIYLPFRVEEAYLGPILAHEQAHIRRGDPWWKLLAFVCLAVHWFNPLVWVAYLLFGRDIEFACDETVIKKLDAKGRAAYARTLMVYGAKIRGVPGMLMAFGATDTKGRIKAVARYRFPVAWRIVLLGICFLLLAVCFLTSPVTAAKEQMPITAVPGEGTLGSDQSANSELSREETLRNNIDRLKRWLAWYEEQLEIYQIWYREASNRGDSEQQLMHERIIINYMELIGKTQTRIETMENEMAKLTKEGL